MSGTKETVLWLTTTELLALFGIFFAVVMILLIVIDCRDHQVSELRRENKLLHRVLEDYYRLEDGGKRAARAIARETGRASWLPPGWIE